MIKVNLRGHKQPKSAAKFVSPKNYIWLLVVLERDEPGC